MVEIIQKNDILSLHKETSNDIETVQRLGYFQLDNLHRYIRGFCQGYPTEINKANCWIAETID